MILLLIAALGISLYLSYIEISNRDALCFANESFDCHAVQSHSTSKMLGIPVAFGGVAANVILLLMLLLENRFAPLQESGVTLVFLGVLFGVLFSVYLIYLQAFVIEAFCIWCLAHEVLYGVLLLLAGWRLREIFRLDAS